MNPAKLGRLSFWTQVIWVSWVLEPSGSVVCGRQSTQTLSEKIGEKHLEESEKYYFVQLS